MRVALVLVVFSGVALLLVLSPRTLSEAGKPVVVLEAVHLWREVPVGRPLDVSFHLRNVGDAPALVQASGGHGFVVRAELLDPHLLPVPDREVGCGTQDCSPLAGFDFTELAPGAFTRSLNTYRLPAPRQPGRHVLRFEYRRERPEMPSLWERIVDKTVTSRTRAAMDRAFHGVLQGQIDIDVN